MEGTKVACHGGVESEAPIMTHDKRVLFILTSADRIGPKARPTGTYVPEVAHPWHVFVHHGYTVDFASVAGGLPPIYGEDTDDGIVRELLSSASFAELRCSRPLREVLDDYEMVFIPGGLGPMVDMAEDERVHAALRSTYERGGVIGAVCHGSVALMNLRLGDGRYLVEGRRVTGFSNAEEERYAKDDVPFRLEDGLRARGARFEAEPPWQAKSIADGRVVTGQNSASAKGVAEAMIAVHEAAHAVP